MSAFSELPSLKTLKNSSNTGEMLGQMFRRVLKMQCEGDLERCWKLFDTHLGGMFLGSTNKPHLFLIFCGSAITEPASTPNQMSCVEFIHQLYTNLNAKGRLEFAAYLEISQILEKYVTDKIMRFEITQAWHKRLLMNYNKKGPAQDQKHQPQQPRQSVPHEGYQSTRVGNFVSEEEDEDYDEEDDESDLDGSDLDG